MCRAGVLFLATCGSYVTFGLLLNHTVGSLLPCPSRSGCDVLAYHPSSRVLGVPVALIGLLAYLAILALTIIRFRGLDRLQQKAFHVSYIIAGLGCTISAILIVYATLVLHLFCLWCWISALTMTALVFAHALEASVPGAPALRIVSAKVPVKRQSVPGPARGLRGFL